METSDEQRATVRKAAFASGLGNFIEWFDYASYSYFATVIAAVFFPTNDPRTGLLQTFAVFAISFILRPFGAILWGAWGDVRGRRWALSVSILLMSGATFAIGLLPGYSQIGIWAPIGLLVFRMVQGFSASGEYAGAATFLAEYAPAEKRGMYVSLVPASTALGLLLGSLSATLLHAVLSTEALNAWGWRLPFLLAGPLGLVARYIRVHLQDSPVYEELMANLHAKNKSEDQGHPIKQVWNNHRKELFISFGVCTLNAVAFYLVLTYLPTYLSTELGVGEDASILASSITLTVYVALIFLSGHISDMFGRKKMLLGACLGFVVFTVPAFMVLSNANFVGILLVEIFLCALLTLNDGTLASYLTETFPTEVRYTGFALSFNMANAIFGGTAMFVGTWLIDLTGSPLAPAWYLVVVAIGAFIAMLLSHENSSKELSDV